MQFERRELTNLINKEFRYDEQGVDITLVEWSTIGNYDVIFWVAGEIPYLGTIDKYGINLIMTGDKEDSEGIEVMREILSAAWKYEDLANS